MSDAESSAGQLLGRPRTANPGLAVLACLAWYAAVVLVFLWYVHRLSGVPDECGFSSCVSDRDGALLTGLFFGAPALFGSLLVSLVVLGILAAKSRIRSAMVLGTLAASPAFVLGLYATTVV
jgi:hypothetical protein